jgi:(p)ppGpp synthase/HD superfamily hydrolase
MQKPSCSENSLVTALTNAKVLTRKVKVALQIAIETHYNQIRDDNQSYLEQHIFPIVIEACNATTSEEKEKAVIVALLHDILEDETPYSVPHLKSLFGEDIVADILVLQKKRTISPIRTQAVKHLEHQELSQQIASASQLVKMIKTIDRLNNLQCTEGYRNKEKYQRFLQDTTEFYLPIAAQLGNTYVERMKHEIARIQFEITNCKVD